MIDGSNYVILNFDGAADPNRSVTHPLFHETRTACGFVVKSASGQLLHREGVFLGNGTSNTAELNGLLRGVTWCLENGFRRVKVRGDSENVIGYVSGRYRIPRHLPHIARLLHQVSRVLALETVPVVAGGTAGIAHDRRFRLVGGDATRVTAIEVQHVHESRNKEADRLATLALAEAP